VVLTLVIPASALLWFVQTHLLYDSRPLSSIRKPRLALFYTLIYPPQGADIHGHDLIGDVLGLLQNYVMESLIHFFSMEAAEEAIEAISDAIFSEERDLASSSLRAIPPMAPCSASSASVSAAAAAAACLLRRANLPRCFWPYAILHFSASMLLA